MDLKTIIKTYKEDMKTLQHDFKKIEQVKTLRFCDEQKTLLILGLDANTSSLTIKIRLVIYFDPKNNTNIGQKLYIFGEFDNKSVFEHQPIIIRENESIEGFLPPILNIKKILLKNLNP